MEFHIRPGRGFVMVSHHLNAKLMRSTHSLDEHWVDSFYGVLESHYRTKTTVDFLQVMVFCDEAVSAPGNGPKWLGLLLVFIFGKRI